MPCPQKKPSMRGPHYEENVASAEMFAKKFFMVYKVSDVNASIFVTTRIYYICNRWEEMVPCCGGVIALQMECFNIHKQDPRCDLTAANHVKIINVN